jgi:hypothetical protein
MMKEGREEERRAGIACINDGGHVRFCPDDVLPHFFPPFYLGMAGFEIPLFLCLEGSSGYFGNPGVLPM